MGSILLVDPNREFRESLALQLRAYGFDVAEADSATLALERVARLVPRVVIVEIELPIVGGLEFLRHLRSRGHYLKIQTMVLTEDSSPRHVIDAARLKVAAYLSKRDFDFASFLQRLVSVMGEAPPIQILFPALRQAGIHDNSVSSAGSEGGEVPEHLPRLDWKRFLGGVSARALKPEAMRILGECCGAGATLSDLESAVQGSPMLAARVLTTANSAAFHRGPKTVRLSDAIAVDELRNLVSTSFLEEHFLNALQEESAWRSWQFGLACGRLMEGFRGSGLALPDGSEYLVGIGLGLVPMIFAQNARNELARIRQWQMGHRAYGQNLLEEVFGVPMDEAWRGMLERAGVPDLMVEPLVAYARCSLSPSDGISDRTNLALELSEQFASAMFFPLSPFFPIRPMTQHDIDVLPALSGMRERWQPIRDEVMVRSFDLARDSEIVREIVSRPFFTRREDVRVELRTGPRMASFGPIRLFLSGICRMLDPVEHAEELSDSLLVLVGDDPASQLRSEERNRRILVLHGRDVNPAGFGLGVEVETLAMPCGMAQLVQTVHSMW